MTAAALLERLRSAGATLTPDGDTFEVDAPAGVLTDEQRGAIRAHKPDLLALLAAEAAANAAAEKRPRAVCVAHGRFLSHREHAAARCSWCHPEGRDDWTAEQRAALAAMYRASEPVVLACLDCGSPIPPERTYRCVPCVAIAA